MITQYFNFNNFFNSPFGIALSIIAILLIASILAWLFRVTFKKSILIAVPESIRNAHWFNFLFDFNGWIESFIRVAIVIGFMALPQLPKLIEPKFGPTMVFDDVMTPQNTVGATSTPKKP